MDIKEFKYSDNIVLPSKGETVAIANKDKTAALCYDRIWSPLREEVPESIRCFGGSQEELNMVRLLKDPNPDLTVEKLIRKLKESDTAEEGLKVIDTELSPLSFVSLLFCTLKISIDYAQSIGFTNISDLPKEQLKNVLFDALKTMEDDPEKLKKFAEDNIGVFFHPTYRKISKSFYKKHKIPLVPVYKSVKERDIEYHEGDRKAIVIALKNIKIVDEDKLTWEQVLEFRKDKEIRSKYRRFLHWLDKDMVGKSQAFIEDEIAGKLEDYENALKKYNIKTVLGTIEEALDRKYLIGASGIATTITYAGYPTWGLLTGAGLIVGKMAVKLRETKLDFEDIERGTNSEISWMYEAKKLGK